MAKTHHSRLERIYHAHDEIVEISKKLQDIEQMMLYAGRIKDSPLADAALDVAIAIHGEPDEAEKKYAESITFDSLKVIEKQVISLIKRRANLEALANKERRKVIDEAYAIHAMETRYKLFKEIVFNCSAVICVAVAIFFLRKIF
jgi:hypothetical protein